MEVCLACVREEREDEVTVPTFLLQKEIFGEFFFFIKYCSRNGISFQTAQVKQDVNTAALMQHLHCTEREKPNCKCSDNDR